MQSTAEIYAPTPENIALCAKRLRDGDVVGLPTETVYGLAANAFDTQALRKIFEVKGRPLIDPLIIHFKNLSSALSHVESNPVAHTLANTFWPGPLTMVLPKKDSIPDIATAGKPSVAIRVPAHPVFQSMLQAADFPLAAPSANPFGYVSPTLATHVSHTLGHRIKAILDGGPSAHGLESTIIDLRNPEHPCILRHGPITHESLEAAINQRIQDSTNSPTNDKDAQVAPGGLTQHYSPNTRLQLFPNATHPDKISTNSNSATVFLMKPARVADDQCFWLSESGDLQEVGHNLFNLIQQLDQRHYALIQVELAPDTQLGRAINDRLRRASAKF